MRDNASGVSVITGASGQDGILLARHLLAQGEPVVALTRHQPSEVERLIGPSPNLRVCQVQSYDGNEVKNVFKNLRFSCLYHLAAQADSAKVHDLSLCQLQVNGYLPISCIMMAYERNPECRFFLALSSEIFTSRNEISTEQTAVDPQSPYGAAKAYAYWLAKYLRRQYGIFIVCGILFNHESCLRSESFLSRRISAGVAKIALGAESSLELRSLESKKDWSSAEDFVRAMVLATVRDTDGDYIFASGLLHSVREFCEVAFDFAGLDYKKYVVTKALLGTTQCWNIGDPAKLMSATGWKPEFSFKRMIHEMVKADLIYYESKIK